MLFYISVTSPDTTVLFLRKLSFSEKCLERQTRLWHPSFAIF